MRPGITRLLIAALVFFAPSIDAQTSVPGGNLPTCPPMSDANVFIGLKGASSQCNSINPSCIADENVTFMASGFNYFFTCANHTFTWWINGQPGSGKEVTVSFPSTGTYPVTLTVSNGIQVYATQTNVTVGPGCGQMTSSNVFVTHAGPTCSTNSPVPCGVGEDISFTVGGNRYNLSCARHTYTWRFGGSTRTGGPSIQHSFGSRGSFPVSVKISNGMESFTPPPLVVQVSGPDPICAGVINTPMLAPATLGLPYDVTIVAGGLEGPLRFSVLEGLLPPGITLSPDGVLAGTPLEPGSYSFRVRAADARVRCGVEASLILQVLDRCPQILVQPGRLRRGRVGAAYLEQLTAAGGREPYVFVITSGSIPKGLTLLGDTISGVPREVGSFTFTIAVVDFFSCVAVAEYAIEIDAQKRRSVGRQSTGSEKNWKVKRAPDAMSGARCAYCPWTMISVAVSESPLPVVFTCTR